ncbi:MAG: YihY/virulence factor BrkB family protein [Acidobacteriota bacterium]
MKRLGDIEWKTFFVKLYNKIMDTDIFGAAAQVGFYFSFSFFPLLFFIVSLFGMVLDSTDALRDQLYVYLARLMPFSAYELVRRTMDEIIENSSGGKLTLGIFITLWSASAGIDSLRSALNQVYQLKESRSWIKTKLQSLALTFLFILLISFSLATVTAGWNFVEFVVASAGFHITSPLILKSMQWIAIITVTIFATAVVYSWLPCFEKFRWFWISPGAGVAILLWLAFSGGFRLYLHYFNSYNRAYGSLGAVIILMLWMYLTGMAILLGGAINSVLTKMSEPDSAKTLDDAAEGL